MAAETVMMVRVAAPATALVRRAVAILARQLRERAGLRLEETTGPAALELAVDPRAGAAEGYTLRDQPGGLAIVGHDERGLLYGIGRYLHTSWVADGAWCPSPWRGTSVPGTHWRGIYIANNFLNWNTVASVADFTAYLEELALWGMNTVAYNFAFSGFAQATPESAARLARCRALVTAAHDLGMSVGLLFCVNCDCPPAPPEALATPIPDATPARRGFDPAFVCPSHPAGHRHLVDWFATTLDRFAGLPVDYLVSFPYDAGGCGCPQCWPWGARGYLRICADLARLGRQRFPGSRFVLGTWCFDVRDESDGEYDGLHRALLASELPWVDALMTDAHGRYPQWPLQHGNPGGRPTINFAEISMWGRYPWGGSGANPFPQRLVTLWREARHLLDGGLPYSEGRFEDLNKHICLGLFWQPDAEAETLVRAYAVAYFSPTVADDLVAAVALLEANYPTEALQRDRAEAAHRLLAGIADRLAPAVAASWRWRLLWLRSVIDVETTRHPEAVSPARNAAYEELTALYQAQRAGNPVAPRAKSYYARADVTLKGPVFAEHIGEQASAPTAIR